MPATPDATQNALDSSPYSDGDQPFIWNISGINVTIAGFDKLRIVTATARIRNGILGMAGAGVFATADAVFARCARADSANFPRFGIVIAIKITAGMTRMPSVKTGATVPRSIT